MADSVEVRYPLAPAPGLDDWPGPPYGKSNRITAARGDLAELEPGFDPPPPLRRAASLTLSIFGEPVEVHGLGHHARQVLSAAFPRAGSQLPATKTVTLRAGDRVLLGGAARHVELHGSTRCQHLLRAMARLADAPLRPGVICAGQPLRVLFTGSDLDAYALAARLVAAGETILAAGYLRGREGSPEPLAAVAPLPTSILAATAAGFLAAADGPLENVGAITGVGLAKHSATIQRVRAAVVATAKPGDARWSWPSDELDDTIGSLLASTSGSALLHLHGLPPGGGAVTVATAADDVLDAS